jgi:hypothetical protein
MTDDAGLTERGRRLGPHGAERISAGVYGALITASTLFGLGDSPLATIVEVVAGTNLVYYATHVFAYTIGSTDETPSWKTVKHHLSVGAPMIGVVFAPLVVVLLLCVCGVDTSAATLWGMGTAGAVLLGVVIAGLHIRRIGRRASLEIILGTTVVAALLVFAKVMIAH